MTTANKVTIVRILLVPVFVILLLYYFDTSQELFRKLALGAFALASVSDGIDGFIARRFNQRSELGAILDPLADKLLLLSAVVLLSLPHAQGVPRLPLWLVATVLSRDALLIIGAGVIRFIGGTVIVRPHWTGKVATVFQMACVIWALLKLGDVWLDAFCLGATAGTAISGIIYIWAGVRQLAASPASSAVPKN